MKLQLSIRHKLFALSTYGILLTILLSGIAFYISNMLDHKTVKVALIGEAIRTQMESDMAHDAVRADVLGALLASAQNDAEGLQAAITDLNEHGKIFSNSIQTLMTMDLAEDSKVAIKGVEPLLESYLVRARKVQSLAQTDGIAAKQELSLFLKTFKELEEAMENVSNIIEGEAKQVRIESADASQNAKLIIISIAAFALLSMWIVSRQVSRSVVGPIRSALEIADKVADGKLSGEVRVFGSGETSHLMQTLKRMHDSLVDIVSTVRSSSENIALGAAQMAAGNADLSQRTGAQTRDLAEATETMRRLNAKVKDNAAIAANATDLASNASASAEHGGQAVQQMNGTMARINEASTRIADIIGVIDGIAFQTNILALNAAVEAARAGEHGRGFAVVASEVRSLAQRSSSAAQEIKSLISASVSQVEDGTRQTALVGETITAVINQVHTVNRLIAEISTATAEQSDGIFQLVDLIGNIEVNIQQTCTLVEQSASASLNLKDQTSHLVDVVSVFRL